MNHPCEEDGSQGLPGNATEVSQDERESANRLFAMVRLWWSVRRSVKQRDIDGQPLADAPYIGTLKQELLAIDVVHGMTPLFQNPALRRVAHEMTRASIRRQASVGNNN